MSESPLTRYQQTWKDAKWDPESAELWDWSGTLYTDYDDSPERVEEQQRRVRIALMTIFSNKDVRELIGYDAPEIPVFAASVCSYQYDKDAWPLSQPRVTLSPGEDDLTLGQLVDIRRSVVDVLNDRNPATSILNARQSGEIGTQKASQRLTERASEHGEGSTLPTPGVARRRRTLQRNLRRPR